VVRQSTVGQVSRQPALNVLTSLVWSLLGPALECPSLAGDVDVGAAHVMFLQDESDMLVDGERIYMLQTSIRTLFNFNSITG